MKNGYEIRGDVTAIYVKAKGKRKPLVTLIDTCDLEKAMALTGTWIANFSKGTKTHYVIGHNRPDPTKKGKTVSMQRFLYDEIPVGLVVDHINHDTLDNRRSTNLRIVTHLVNRHNRKSKKAG